MIGAGSVKHSVRLCLLALGLGLPLATPLIAQQLTTSSCNSGKDNPPACNAVRGDRAEGWPAQTRSEVMARHGMVATSEPLAAQAGLDILRKGGNAVDAAVATAAVLNLIEPMNVGVAGDLFAIIYTAKDHKLHVLNASGMAASGQTVAFMNSKGYRADPANWGPQSGMPSRGIFHRHRAGRGLGLAGGVGQVRHHEFQAGAGAGRDLCQRRGGAARTHRT